MQLEAQGDLVPTGIACVSDRHCLVVGGSGSPGFGVGGGIVHTTDGGATWIPAPEPSDGSQMVAVTCVTRTRCLAVGGDEVLLTPNAGASWARLPALASVGGLSDVACASVDRCFAVGRPDQTAILEETTDGGLHWSTPTIPVLGGVTDLACASQSFCSGIGSSQLGSSCSAGGLLTTSDGGTTWQRTPPPLGDCFTTGSCPSPVVCFVDADVTGAGTEVLLKTTDAGATWTELTIPTNLPATQIDCTSVSDCMILGWSVQMGFESVSTQNGGASWTASSGARGNNAASALTCLDIGHCFAISRSTVLQTSDAGATWSAAGTPTQSWLDAVDCPTVSNCYVGGLNGIEATTNGGNYWFETAMPAAGDPIANISCATSTECLSLSTNGGVFYTADGGRSWIETTLSVGIFEISCASGNICVASGVAGTFFSSNGGSAWQPSLLSASVRYLSAIACLTGGRCVAAAVMPPYTAPTIAVSSNGGESWNVEAAPPAVSFLGSVACPSILHCLIGGLAEGQRGQYPVVLSSSDGAVTWTTEVAPAGVIQMGVITCPSARVCFALDQVGTNTGFLTSDDGGTTWTPQALAPVPLPLGGGPNSLSCARVDYCVAVGYSQTFGALIESLQPPLMINTTTVPAGTVGEFFSAQLRASGGPRPYEWFVTSGSAPPGIRLSTAGLLSGRPQRAGTYWLVVEVRDGRHVAATEVVGIQVLP